MSLYGRALFGAALSRVSSYADPRAGVTLPCQSSTNFAMGYGGGLDISIHQRIALRVIQVDYVPILVRETDEAWRHNLRFQLGEAWRLGP